MVVFRYLYAPLYFFGFVGGATAIVSSDSSPAWLLVLVIAAIGTSLAAEHIAPFENQWNSSHGDGGRDVLHALVNEGSLVAMVLLLPLIASLVPWESAWPTTLPLPEINFAQAVLADDEQPADHDPCAAVTVDLGNGRCVRISSNAPAALVSATLKALR